MNFELQSKTTLVLILLVSLYSHIQSKYKTIQVRVHATCNIQTRSCLFIVLSVLEVTQRVPPCTHQCHQCHQCHKYFTYRSLCPHSSMTVQKCLIVTSCSPEYPWYAVWCFKSSKLISGLPHTSTSASCHVNNGINRSGTWWERVGMVGGGEE
jgi:hypothetical protein